MNVRGLRPQRCVYMLFSGDQAQVVPFLTEDSYAKSVFRQPGWVAELGLTSCGHYVRLFGSFGGLLCAEMLVGGPLKSKIIAADSCAMAEFDKFRAVQLVARDESFNVGEHRVDADFELSILKRMKFSPLEGVKVTSEGGTLELGGLWGRSKLSVQAIEGGIEIQSVHEFAQEVEGKVRKVIPLTTKSRFLSQQLNTDTAFEQLALVG